MLAARYLAERFVLFSVLLLASCVGDQEPEGQELKSTCPLQFQAVSWPSEVLYNVSDSYSGSSCNDCIGTLEIPEQGFAVANFEQGTASMRLRIRGCSSPCDVTTTAEYDFRLPELFLCERYSRPDQNTENVLLRSKDERFILFGFSGVPPWSFVVTDTTEAEVSFTAAQEPFE